MIGKLHLFVAACVFAFAFVSEVYSQSSCSTAVWGNTTGIPYKFPSVHLPPPNRYWQVTINNPCLGLPNGLVASACDFDRPPVEIFKNANVLYITRTGNVDGVAIVDIIAFCQQFPFGAPLQSVPRAQPIIQKNQPKFL